MILLLGGTSETAPLAQALAAHGYRVLVSLATRVPLELPPHARISRRSGPLDAPSLADLVAQRRVKAIVDATHPYAREVKLVARRVSREQGLPYLRFARPATLVSDVGTDPLALPSNAGPKGPAPQPVEDHAQAAQRAAELGGAILLTTGSRHLDPYVREARRLGRPLFARVLPEAESLAACRQAGIPEDHVIAARGPFSVEENCAALREHRIAVLVTKDSGAAGGFPEKLEAARREGCSVVVIRRPTEFADGPAYDKVADLVAALEKEVSLAEEGA